LVHVVKAGVRPVAKHTEVTGFLRLQWDATEQLGEGRPEPGELLAIVAELRTLVPFKDEAQMEVFVLL